VSGGLSSCIQAESPPSLFRRNPRLLSGSRLKQIHQRTILSGSCDFICKVVNPFIVVSH
jgi:hypothetical protein